MLGIGVLALCLEGLDQRGKTPWGDRQAVEAEGRDLNAGVPTHLRAHTQAV